MKSFDQMAAKNVHDEMVKELQALGKRIGVEFTKDGGKWDFTSMSLKIKVVPADKEVLVLEEARDFKSWCKSYGFDETDYKREYVFRGEKYEFVGFNLSKPKFSIKMKRKSDGAAYSFPRKQVMLVMHKERVSADGGILVGAAYEQD